MSRTRTLTTLFALGRMGFGVGLLVKPEWVAAGWIGELAQRDPVKLMLRAVGGRDIARSAGALPGNARWGTVVLGGGSALAGAALIAAVRR